MPTTTRARLRRGPRRGRSAFAGAIALCNAIVLSIGAIPITGLIAAGAATPETGFTQPFSGTPRYQHLAATEIGSPDQLNQPIGQKAADVLAAHLGLSRRDAFTPEQYVEFISGGGIGGNKDDAKLIDQSVRIFTNTIGRPLYSNVDGHLTATTLASYGLFVSSGGLLESLANADAPTRQVNRVIEPGQYMGRWCRANGATATLRALYSSAYPVEAAFGFESQQISGNAQLVANHLGGVDTTVGMSMVPSIWLVNFILLYVLNPSVAALMPAHWAPIPATVADAIESDPNGQVPFGAYESSFPSSVTG